MLIGMHLKGSQDRVSYLRSNVEDIIIEVLSLQDNPRVLTCRQQ